MSVSAETAIPWRRVLGILVAFLISLLATSLVAWRASRLSPPLLAPGDAALYRVTDGPDKRGLYAIHVVQPGPFLYDAASTSSLVRVEGTGFDPASGTAMRSTSFYSREHGGLYVAGLADAYGGSSFTPAVPVWLPGEMPDGPARVGRTVWQQSIGPWNFSQEMRYSSSPQPDTPITMPMGAFSYARRFDWNVDAGSFAIQRQVWYADDAPLLPLLWEERVTPGDGFRRYKLLSASWLSPPTGISPAEEVGSSGPTFLDRGGPGRHGISQDLPATEINPGVMSLYWHFVAPDDLTSPPLWAGDLLLVGDDKGVLWALDAVRGEVRWTFTTGRAIVAAPAVAGGIVYVAGGERLYALDVREGLYLWSIAVEDVIDASPLVVGDLLFVGAEDGFFYALDARRGTLRWRFPAGAPIVGGAAAAQGIVYFGTTEGAFYALTADDGDLRWQRDLGGTISSNPTVYGGTVYVGLGGGLAGGRVVALDPREGSPLWTAPVPGDVTHAVAVDEGSVYASTSIGLVLALDRETGIQRWQVRLAGQEFNAPLILGDVLVLTDTAGSVRILNKATGRAVAWRRGLAPFGASVTYGRGLLFVVDRSRGAYAFTLGRQAANHALRFSLGWHRLAADPQAGGRPLAAPVAWARRLLLLLNNGDLWLFDPEGGAGTRAARLGGSTPYPPQVSGDTAYIALVQTEQGRGSVVAFDLARRRTRWRVNLDGLLQTPLEIAEGRVFVSVVTPEESRLLALDGDTGKRLWEEKIPSGAPLAAGGRVHLAGKHVFAQDAGTGRLRWQSPDIGAGGALALCGDALYVGGMSGEGPALVALDLSSGQVRWWSADPVAFPFSRAACDPEGDQVLVGGLDGRIHAYDAATGEERWTYQAGEPFLSELVIADGVVYGVTGQTTLVAVEARSGRLLARYAAPHAGASRAAPLLMGNRVYLVDDFSLYALELIHE